MKPTQANLRWLFFCISAMIFFAGGAAHVLRASNDFVPVYTGARCLLYGCNPYDTAQLEQQFYRAGGHAGELPSWDIDVPVYPPSTFLALSPLAWFRFPTARLIWFLLNSCLFVTAAAMIAARTRAWTGTLLTSFLLLTGSILLVLGQPAAIAVSLLAIGTCLLLRGRLLPLATLVLVLSLAVKPQIGGLLIMYLLLQRIQWRYAAAALAGALGLLLCGAFVLHLHPRSTHWADTLHSNLAATLSPGGSADPRPANPQAVGDLNLQALTSIYFTSPQAFNIAAYVLFAGLLVTWLWAVARARPDVDGMQERLWLALGALVILSLLPVYHRFYDSRLLLLTIPAAVMMMRRRRALGLWIVSLTAYSLISVQYRVQAYLLQHTLFERVLQHKFLFLLLLRQQTLGLLLLFALYVLSLGTIPMTTPAPDHEPSLVSRVVVS